MMTPALAVQYGALPLRVTMPPTDAVLIIDPLPASTMCGIEYFE